MKYTDYRKKLGIGFDDEQKAQMLNNSIELFLRKICNTICGSFNGAVIIGEVCEEYFMTTFEKQPEYSSYGTYRTKNRAYNLFCDV